MNTSVCVCLCVCQTHPDAWPFMEPVKKSEAPDYYEIIRFPIGEYASALQVSWKSGGLLALPGPHRALHVYILPLSSSSLLRITAVVSSSIKRNHVDLER